MALKVEHNHHSQVIVDHIWFGVNDHTVSDLPHEVMQFSGMLPHLLWLLQHADPAEGPVYLSKYDLTDGFYQIFLAADDALKLANGETQLVAMPLSLTMGWTNSPPMFIATSKTAADLTNAQLCCRQTCSVMPPHHLEDIAFTHDSWDPPVPLVSPTADLDSASMPMTLLMPTFVPPCKPLPATRPPLLIHEGPVAHVDICIDDFIGLAQGLQTLCHDTKRYIRMHVINQVMFTKPDEETQNRKEAVSETKMNKGNGGWNNAKRY